MPRSHPPRAPRPALTLVELMVTLAVLVGLAGLVVPLLTTSVDEAKDSTTRASMKQLSDVIMGQYRLDMSRKLPRPGTISPDSSRQPKPQLRFLFYMPAGASAYNPDTKLGWRGPYMMWPTGTYTVTGTFTKEYGEDGDPALLDGWGRPIIIVESTTGAVEIRSAGSDGVLFSTDDIRMDLIKVS